MRSLFLKIFVWFWIVQFVIGAVLFALTTAMRFQPTDANHRPETEYTMNLIARSAAAAYEKGGIAALKENLRGVEEKARVHAYLFDEKGRQILDWPVPPPLRDLAVSVALSQPNRAPRSHSRHENSRDENAPPDDSRDENSQSENVAANNENQSFGPFNARVVLSPKGRRFVLASQIQRPPPRGLTPGFIADLIRPSGPSALRLLILMLTSGVLCYGLARYLTSPAVKLRGATRQLAGGDLSARVGAKMGRRRDELADLGHDFDQMAERIETLMLSERRLLGDISHELRSPLTRMTVALDLVEDILDDHENAEKREENAPNSAIDSESSTRNAADTRDEMRPYLARMRRESERLNALIGQLLTLSRLESGSSRVEETPVNLAQMLADIVQDADFEARSRDCRVQISHSDELWTCGAPELIHSAIENVVRNAVNYTAKNSAVEISLQREIEVSGDKWALIRVLDRGAGVPESALENLFRPFYRVADARDRQSGGTGLGLAITERALRLHGGKVAAQNAKNGGLQVDLRFRLTENAPQTET